MDYHAIHGHDVHDFGTPLAYRVLTVSAADADAALLSPSLASSTSSGPTTPVHHVPTGIATLDMILSGSLASDTCAGEVELEKDGAPTKTEAGTPTEPGLLSTGTKQNSQKQNQNQNQNPKISRWWKSGLRRGQLTEIWGPPGAGKTVFGMQLVANALRAGSSAVWVDCFHSLCSERLMTIIETQAGVEDGAKSVEEGLAHYACPSLPHFVAMFCSSSLASMPDIPTDASVMIIDSLSALVNYALPRTVDRRGAPLMANGKRGPAAHEKRTQVLQYIIAALERLAETRNLAIVLLTQCASRMQSDGGGAALVPAINAVVWDRGIATRLVLFRDWAWKDDETVGGRFVGIQKLNCSGGDPALSHVVAFSITEACSLHRYGIFRFVSFRFVSFHFLTFRQGGLIQEQYSAVPPQSSEFALKRKLGDAGLGGNSDEENYGWGDQDSMPNMPPQWQGSEDLLLGHQYEDSEEEEEGGDEGEGDEEEEEDGEDVGGEAAIKVGRTIERPDAEPQAHGSSKRSLYNSVADSEDDSDT